ncbi:hypothetical protein KC323_g4 [Hortaea werneckii]|nr:hypothetical protein KC323_g4 [Hortaea werneckii]
MNPPFNHVAIIGACTILNAAADFVVPKSSAIIKVVGGPSWLRICDISVRFKFQTQHEGGRVCAYRSTLILFGPAGWQSLPNSSNRSFNLTLLRVQALEVLFRKLDAFLENLGCSESVIADACMCVPVPCLGNQCGNFSDISTSRKSCAEACRVGLGRIVYNASSRQTDPIQLVRHNEYRISSKRCRLCPLLLLFVSTIPLVYESHNVHRWTYRKIIEYLGRDLDLKAILISAQVSDTKFGSHELRVLKEEAKLLNCVQNASQGSTRPRISCIDMVCGQEQGRHQSQHVVGRSSR